MKKFTSFLIVACSLVFVSTVSLSSGNSQEKPNRKSHQLPNYSRNTEESMRSLLQQAKVEQLATGFKFLEGPLWNRNFLLFSDTPANIIYKWTPNQQIEVFRHPAGYPNGNTLDREGRLVTAQHDRRVTRTQRNGEVVTLASLYEGKKTL